LNKSKLAYRIYVILIANKELHRFYKLICSSRYILNKSKLAYRIYVILIANKEFKKCIELQFFLYSSLIIKAAPLMSCREEDVLEISSA
jgi:hypothetical protein